MVLFFHKDNLAHRGFGESFLREVMLKLRLEGQVGVGQSKRGGKGISSNGSTRLVKDKLSRRFQKCCLDGFFLTVSYKLYCAL